MAARHEAVHRNSRRSRAAILEAAGRIFAEHGLAGARTDAIAAAAGVNKALLYYYFKSKDALYRAVLEEQLTGFHVRALGLLSQPGSAAQVLLRYVGEHFDFIRAHPHYPRLFQRMMLTGDPRGERLVAERMLPVAQKLGTLLRRGMRDGELRECDVLHTAISLVALTVFYFNSAPIIRLVSGAEPFSPANMRKRKAEVLAFIRHALLLKPEASAR